MSKINKASLQSQESGAEHVQKGVNLRRQRKLKAAIHEFEQAVAADPEHAMAWYYLGVSYDNRGEERKAIPCYLRAIEINPALPDLSKAWLYLASSYQKTGDITSAVEALKKARELGVRCELTAQIERRIKKASPSIR